MANYANYILVENAIDYEYKSGWTVTPIQGGQQWARTTQRRPVTRRTWEATIRDDDNTLPTPANPGSLDSSWQLESLVYSRTLSAPMSKHVRETWSKKGDWETIAQ